MSASEDSGCGAGCCRVGCLGRCANIQWFTGLYSVSGLLTSSLAVYITSQITTIERQFGLSSTKSGYLMACNDIGYSVFILIASYLANKVHVPRFLGTSALLYGVSGILCSLPYFIADQNTFVSADLSSNASSSFIPPLCNASSPITHHENTSDSMVSQTDTDTRSLDTRYVSFVLLALGMVVQGIGKAPRSPMLSQYVDDNTDKRDTGMYMGIITSIAVFGPAVAFGLGGYFSQIYVTLKDVDLHPRDPRWIGAWWLGFLTFGSLSVLFGLPLFCFPAKLKRHVDMVKPERQDTPTISRRGRCGKGISGFFLSMVRVFRSPLYVLILLTTLLNVLAAATSMSFGPKYMEVIFNEPAWKANIIIAVVGILSICIGSFLGGWLTKHFKLNPPRTIMLLLVVQVPCIILTVVTMFLYCEEPIIRNWPGQKHGRDSNSTCWAAACDCHHSATYLPICGTDGNNYFSPCHAGCNAGTVQKFTGCSCIPGGEAVIGLCVQDCNKLLPFSIISFTAGLFSATQMIPSFILLLRSVPNEVKSMGVGIFSLTMSLLGWIPGPVIGGKVVDGSCILWSDKGSCSLYETESLRFNLFGMNIAIRSLSVLMLAGTLWYCWSMLKWPSEEGGRHGDRPQPEHLGLIPKHTNKDSSERQPS